MHFKVWQFWPFDDIFHCASTRMISSIQMPQAYQFVPPIQSLTTTGYIMNKNLVQPSKDNQSTSTTPIPDLISARYLLKSLNDNAMEKCLENIKKILEISGIFKKFIEFSRDFKKFPEISWKFLESSRKFEKFQEFSRNFKKFLEIYKQNITKQTETSKKRIYK